MLQICHRTVLKVIYQRAFLTKMHIIAAIHYWLITTNPDKVLNETPNQCQEDRKQNSTDEENDIENDEGNQLGEKVVDSGKHCSVISPKNVLRVSYAEVLK